MNATKSTEPTTCLVCDAPGKAVRSVFLQGRRKPWLKLEVEFYACPSHSEQVIQTACDAQDDETKWARMTEAEARADLARYV